MADARPQPGRASQDAAVGPVPMESRLARTVGRAGLVLTVRKIIVMAVLAVSSVFVARILGSHEFGAYAAGLGTVQLLAAFADLGFTLLLSRELAQDEAGRGALVRASLRVQLLWSLAPFTVAVVLAVNAGLDDVRGRVILIASPLILAAGLSSIRQVYLVLFRVRFVAAVDLVTNVAGALATVSVAWITGSPVWTAAIVMLAYAANTVIVAVAGFGQIDEGRPVRHASRGVLRRAAPLGIASVLASAYFTIDLVILGWLVEGPSLGDYAVASKFLTLIVAVPVLLASVALPGLARTAGDPTATALLASRLLHWLAIAGLPLCAGALVFAEPVIRTVFGVEYSSAAPLVRVLSIAAGLGLVANVLGTVLVALALVRPQLISNSVALVFNVSANIALVPTFGVMASAWATVATEGIVVLWALAVLKGRIPLQPLARAVWKPLIATGALVATGLPLIGVPLVGIALATIAFIAVTFLTGDWPEEFRRSPRPERTGSAN